MHNVTLSGSYNYIFIKLKYAMLKNYTNITYKRFLNNCYYLQLLFILNQHENTSGRAT